MFRFARRALFALVVLLIVPIASEAQTLASITGVVRDTSGAVLPGVTVEAASPVLIEKVRSVVTDGSGQYRIEGLRPGAYTVTFTLPGFSSVRREGIELSGSFAATVNADMAVGAVEETITVSGESPVVDVQNTVQQRVIDRAIIDTIPAGRDLYNIAGATIPGITVSQRDVGGVNTNRSTTPPSLSIHGGGDQQLFQNGIAMMAAARTSYGFGGQQNNAGTQEINIDTAAGSAEASTGGVRVNLIPRDGGNVFSGVLAVNFTNEALQAYNLTDALKARGLRDPNTIKRSGEINPGFGGPIKRDRLWFYLSGRYTWDQSTVAGMYENRNANNPSAWTFDPDLSRPILREFWGKEAKVRFSWQAKPKHKLGLTWHEQTVCDCPTQITATVAPEAGSNRPQPVIRVAETEWTSPLTNRLLLEAGFLFNRLQSNELPVEGFNAGMISVVEQSSGLRYRSAELWRRQPHSSSNFSSSVSYITGTHATKFGFAHRSGWIEFYSFDFQPLTYRFNNGVPNQLTERALPTLYANDINHDVGVYGQDKWTVRGMTLTYGLRYDYFKGSFPETHIGPAVLAPTRNFTFAKQDNLAWKDITPRMGGSYDLFGYGKTALKASANKYLQNGGGGFGGDTSILGGGAPANSLVTSTTRSWTDGNRNFVADCDLLNPNANGECGAIANRNFGSTQPGTTYDPATRRGWGVRGFNWEFSGGVQHELLPGVAVDFSYFRRVFGNRPVTYDRNLTPADYDPFSITAPVDPRLPGGGGYVISGLYNLKPEKFGLPTNVLYTASDNFGKEIRHWNGFDLTVNARSLGGVLLRGGLSTGGFSTDNCDVVTKLNNPSTLYCHSDEKFQTQIKVLASYTVPRVGVLLSGVYQSLPGPNIVANFNAPNALVATSLGRNLSGGAANVTVNLVEPGQMWGERLHQVDVRVAKILRAGKSRTQLGIDIFNLLNSSPVTAMNNSFAVWQQPSEVLISRFARLGVQIDF
jgi:hypothetical protein